MTHHIQSFAQKHAASDPFRHTKVEPVHDGEYGSQPILTINSGRYVFNPETQEREAVEAVFYLRKQSGVDHPDALIVNPWSDRMVTIEREDLYALRALLNELPESAFVEPAPAVKVPEWKDGDVVEYASEEIFVVYTRDAYSWDRWSSMSGHSKRGWTDAQIEEKIASSRPGREYVARRKGGVNL